MELLAELFAYPALPFGLGLWIGFSAVWWGIKPPEPPEPPPRSWQASDSPRKVAPRRKFPPR